jgi:hypothetical protein
MSIMNASPNAVEIRTEHLEHEASVRGIGLLYYFVSGFLCLLGSFMLLTTFLAANSPPLRFPQMLWVGTLLFALGFFYWKMARGIRQFRIWTRTPSTILSVIGLLGIPLGTLINGYILYLLHSKKGNTVFSPEYQTIIAETPQIVYKTSRIISLLALFLIAGFVLVIVIAASSIDWTARPR